MKKVILLAALALAAGAWAQDPKKEEPKPAAQAEEMSTDAKPKPAAAAKKKFTPRRFQDARHCLQKGSNDEIIKCAEAYL
jgi:hypothetical protein